MIHQGNLIIETPADAANCAAVTEVTGTLVVSVPCKLPALPALTTVGGGLAIHADATLPALTTLGGDLRIRADAALSALTTVGRGLYIHAATTLPALTTVAGYLRIIADAALPALTSAQGVKGRLLCVSTYGLWLGDNDLLYAGCRGGLTVAQALAHWDRDDRLAIKFTAAIKALQTN